VVVGTWPGPGARRARGCVARGASLLFLPRRRPYDQPLLFPHLPGRYCPEAAAGQSGGRRVHRRQGSCRCSRVPAGPGLPTALLRPVPAASRPLPVAGPGLRPLLGLLGTLRAPRPLSALCPEPTAPVAAASSSLHPQLLPQPSEPAGALTACPRACRPFATA